MKRFLPALVISLLLVQVFILPASAAGFGFRAPTVVTLAATNITPFSATLNGRVALPSFTSNYNGSLTPVSDISEYYSPALPSSTGYFRYGASPGSLTSSTSPVVLPFGQTTITFTGAAAGLLPCSTYYAQAVVVLPFASGEVDYHHVPSSALIALSPSSLSGLGIGLNHLIQHNLYQFPVTPTMFYGNIISFATPGCSPVITPHGTGAMAFNGGAVGLSNITVQTASVASSKVAPGEKVDITATVTNRGTANGATSITLYINGQEVESQGITLASGQSTPLHFFVSKNEPGTYSVQVGGVSAGSFTVDTFANNDILIYGIIGLFTVAIAGVLFMLARKRPV